jgi:pyruvate kinase
VSSHSPVTTGSTSHRLVATLGPSSFGHAAGLVRAGATELRLNASHMSPDELFRRCAEVRAELPDVRCIVDLQGNKMRVGTLASRQLELGAEVILTRDSRDRDGVFVPHPELFEQTAVGERLCLDDGKIEIEIIRLEPARLVARVQRAGLLQSRKGINRVEHPIDLCDLTPTDEEAILRGLAFDGIDFAVSFVKDGTEATWVRNRAPDRRVILKIERSESIANLPKVVQAGDELWICRGDLGVQMGLSTMAKSIADIDPRKYSTPILMAGQVLEHLRLNDAPTRSEVCHLHDLIVRGYAGIVLSDETAIGAEPESATRWAAQLMRDVDPR